jgi:hypothetical protein
VSDASKGSGSETTWPSRLLWRAVAGLIAVYLVALLLSTAVLVPRQTERLYGEAVVLEQARRVAAGKPLYPAPLEVPLTVTAYPPLYYTVVAYLQRLTGDSSYAVGRLTSAAAMFGSAALIAWCVRSAAGRWWPGLLASGLFLTQSLTVLLWTSAHRVDALALCLSLLGLVLASERRVPAAALVLVLAALTKQTFVAAPIAVCVTLWPCRRTLLRFLGLFAGGLLVAAAASLALLGGWVAWHTVAANAKPWDFEYLAAQLGAFLQFNALPLCLAAGVFALRERPGERLWRAYFFTSCILSLAIIGKLGASSNYWLELTAAIAVLIGLHAGRLEAEPRMRAPYGASQFAGLTLASLLMAIPAYQSTVYESLALRFLPPTGATAAQLEAAQIAAREPGDVLTDEPALALLASKRIEFEFVIFTLLAHQGVWDERPILDAIGAQRFGLVVLTQSLDAPPKRIIEARWSENVREALLAAYEPAGQYAGYYLYRPRPLGRGATTGIS